MSIKQIIVIRKDLRNFKGEKLRTGKLCSQAAHASLGIILEISKYRDGILHLHCPPSSYMHEWLYCDSFTKITLAVNSLDELLEIEEKLLSDNIRTKLIIDNGKTEFNNVKTPTCLATEPYDSDILDRITGHLSLY